MLRLPAGSSEGRLESGEHQDRRKIWARQNRFAGSEDCPPTPFQLAEGLIALLSGRGMDPMTLGVLTLPDQAPRGAFSLLT